MEKKLRKWLTTSVLLLTLTISSLTPSFNSIAAEEGSDSQGETITNDYKDPTLTEDDKNHIEEAKNNKPKYKAVDDPLFWTNYSESTWARYKQPLENFSYDDEGWEANFDTITQEYIDNVADLKGYCNLVGFMLKDGYKFVVECNDKFYSYKTKEEENEWKTEKGTYTWQNAEFDTAEKAAKDSDVVPKGAIVNIDLNPCGVTDLKTLQENLAKAKLYVIKDNTIEYKIPYEQVPSYIERKSGIASPNLVSLPDWGEVAIDFNLKEVDGELKEDGTMVAPTIQGVISYNITKNKAGVEGRAFSYVIYQQGVEDGYCEQGIISSKKPSGTITLDDMYLKKGNYSIKILCAWNEDKDSSVSSRYYSRDFVLKEDVEPTEDEGSDDAQVIDDSETNPDAGDSITVKYSGIPDEIYTGDSFNLCLETNVDTKMSLNGLISIKGFTKKSNFMITENGLYNYIVVNKEGKSKSGTIEITCFKEKDIEIKEFSWGDFKDLDESLEEISSLVQTGYERNPVFTVLSILLIAFGLVLIIAVIVKRKFKGKGKKTKVLSLLLIMSMFLGNMSAINLDGDTKFSWGIHQLQAAGGTSNGGNFNPGAPTPYIGTVGRGFRVSIVPCDYGLEGSSVVQWYVNTYTQAAGENTGICVMYVNADGCFGQGYAPNDMSAFLNSGAPVGAGICAGNDNTAQDNLGWRDCNTIFSQITAGVNEYSTGRDAIANNVNYYCNLVGAWGRGGDNCVIVVSPMFKYRSSAAYNVHYTNSVREMYDMDCWGQLPTMNRTSRRNLQVYIGGGSATRTVFVNKEGFPYTDPIALGFNVGWCFLNGANCEKYTMAGGSAIITYNGTPLNSSGTDVFKSYATTGVLEDANVGATVNTSSSKISNTLKMNVNSYTKKVSGASYLGIGNTDLNSYKMFSWGMFTMPVSKGTSSEFIVHSLKNGNDGLVGKNNLKHLKAHYSVTNVANYGIGSDLCFGSTYSLESITYGNKPALGTKGIMTSGYGVKPYKIGGKHFGSAGAFDAYSSVKNLRGKNVNRALGLYSIALNSSSKTYSTRRNMVGKEKGKDCLSASVYVKKNKVTSNVVNIVVNQNGSVSISKQGNAVSYYMDNLHSFVLDGGSTDAYAQYLKVVPYDGNAVATARNFKNSVNGSSTNGFYDKAGMMYYQFRQNFLNGACMNGSNGQEIQDGYSATVGSYDGVHGYTLYVISYKGELNANSSASKLVGDTEATMYIPDYSLNSLYNNLVHTVTGYSKHHSGGFLSRNYFAQTARNVTNHTVWGYNAIGSLYYYKTNGTNGVTIANDTNHRNSVHYLQNSSLGDFWIRPQDDGFAQYSAYTRVPNYSVNVTRCTFGDVRTISSITHTANAKQVAGVVSVDSVANISESQARSLGAIKGNKPPTNIANASASRNSRALVGSTVTDKFTFTSRFADNFGWGDNKLNSRKSYISHGLVFDNRNISKNDKWKSSYDVYAGSNNTYVSTNNAVAGFRRSDGIHANVLNITAKSKAYKYQTTQSDKKLATVGVTQQVIKQGSPSIVFLIIANKSLGGVELKYYPEVKMVGYVLADSPRTDNAVLPCYNLASNGVNRVHTALTTAVTGSFYRVSVLTMCEKLRRTESGTMRFAIITVPDKIDGVLSSETFGSSIKSGATGSGDKQSLYAGSNFSLQIKGDGGASFQAFSYSYDVVDPSDRLSYLTVDAEGNESIGEMEYQGLIADNSDIYGAWGNSENDGRNKVRLRKAFDDWVNELKNSFTADVILKDGSDDNSNELNNNFSLTFGAVKEEGTTKEYAFPIVIRNGDVDKACSGYKALLKCFLEEAGIPKDNATLVASAEETIKTYMLKPILNTIESSTSQYNMSGRGSDGASPEAVFGSDKWYDEQVKTIVIRHYVSPKISLGDMVLEDKLEYSKSSNESSSLGVGSTTKGNIKGGHFNICYYFSQINAEDLAVIKNSGQTLAGSNLKLEDLEPYNPEKRVKQKAKNPVFYIRNFYAETKFSDKTDFSILPKTTFDTRGN